MRPGARFGAGAVPDFSVTGFDLVGATGGALADFPGGVGGPLGARFESRRFCLEARLFGAGVAFLGFLLNGFDGSSFDPKSSCLRPDLKPTCHKGWLRQFGSVPKDGCFISSQILTHTRFVQGSFRAPQQL